MSAECRTQNAEQRQTLVDRGILLPAIFSYMLFVRGRVSARGGRRLHCRTMFGTRMHRIREITKGDLWSRRTRKQKLKLIVSKASLPRENQLKYHNQRLSTVGIRDGKGHRRRNATSGG